MRAAQRVAMETADTRVALLAAARQCFCANGYHGTNVSDIVSAVGMAQGSFYNYFRTKKAIFQELLQTFVERIVKAIEEVDLDLVKDDTSYYLVGMSLGTTLSRIFLEERELAQIFLREAMGIEPEFDTIVDGAYRRATLATQAYIERGQRVGVVRTDVSAKVTAMAMVGMCSHLINCFLRNEFDGVAPQEILRSLVSVHLKGILKRGEEGKRQPVTETSVMEER